ncbi:MAG: NAD(P)-binding protein [Pseudomonadota bacterium]
MKTIAVIGAGLSGLVFARKVNTDAKVVIFEKSRGFGGRMATRRAEPLEFDHGAQFFTAKGDYFQDFLKPYMVTGVVKTWNANVVHLNNGAVSTRDSEHPLLVASPRMNSLARELGDGLSVKTTTHINSLLKRNNQWFLTDKEGVEHGPFDWVVTSAPAAQSAELLPDSFAHHGELSKVKMAANFTLMIGLDEAPDLGFDGAFVENSPIGWIAVNSTKPDRPHHPTLLVQSTNTWADEHVNEDKCIVEETLLRTASELVGLDLTKVPHKNLHRWLYASTPVAGEKPYLIDEQNCLAAIGDWCIRGRVEAAFESGRQLGEQIQKII